MSVNEKILDKIKNLLSLAEDGGDDEESQTALLMAQKLMLKYKISQNELNEEGEQKIVTKSLSVYKRVFWWEKELVKVIAENFRCMFYMQSTKLPHKSSVQRKIVLMGYPEDVELAYEVYHLAADTMSYYAGKHIKENSKESNAKPSDLRKSYYLGFIDGLKNKFKKQREALIKEDEKYALVIQTPKEVKEHFEEQVTGSLAYKSPKLSKQNRAYMDGYKKGTNLEVNQKQLEVK